MLLNTYGVKAISKQVISKEKKNLYNEAELITNQYAELYYSHDATLEQLYTQLKCVDTLLGTRIWIVNADGKLLVDSASSFENQPVLNIFELDPGLVYNNTKENIYYEAYFKEPMLMASSNVVTNYKTIAYVLVFLPNSSIIDSCIDITDVINIFILIFLLLHLFALLVLYYLCVLPLQKLTKAAKEYSDGHYEYPLNITSHDEFWELGNALTYLATELNSLDDYQKNFVANISHDFRSPLTSIKGYAEAILDGTIPYEMQNKYLEIILFETERLNKLTHNLLTLNSYERNGALLNITTFDIIEVIKRTLLTFEGTCTKRKIIFKLDFSSKQSYVKADMDKIQQVLYNLIDNALKFSHSNSHIKITTLEKGEKVFISVKDYGIGIPKDSLNKIWERFYKTDTSRGKDKKGTGLGLSIAKEIINAHNQNINVISTEGVGTEFIFSLPLVEVE